MIAFIEKLPWSILIVLCLTIGLAPFNPPHIWEKLHMLTKGELSRPVDWLDLLMHGTPWILLVVKMVTALSHKS